MAEYKPLTKEERAEIDVRIAKMYRVYHQTETHETLAQAIRRYEATVQDRDDRIAALEADNAHLRPLAEVGEAAMRYATARRALRESNEGIGVLDRLHNMDAAFNELLDAALRAAKGEACSSDS